MDAFTTATMNAMVPSLFADAKMDLVNRYFGGIVQSQTEEIDFDVVKGSRRVSPFCSPLVEGKIVEQLGYETRSFKPAYVKDKRVFLTNRAFRRAAGEAFGGTMAPQERMLRILATEQQDQLSMLARRQEVMAGEILATGKVTISGDKYPTTVVDFARDASLLVTLSGGARWNQAGTDPMADLETWANNVLALEGPTPRDVIMDLSAWKIFRSNAAIVTVLNRYNQFGNTLRPDLNAEEGLVSMGAFSGFNFYVYQQLYYDDVTASTKQVIPANTVVLATQAMDGYQAYGAIRDHRAGLVAQPSFSKSWYVEDPSVLYIMMQSAPLLVPRRPNSFVTATIA